MRLPRDVSGRELVRLLERRLGYELVRQSGSHVRLTAKLPSGSHHVTVPLHDAIQVGTLGSILNDVAQASGQSRDEVAEELFGPR